MTISLNDEQARAARTLTGPVLVTAGAGSGKTRMLTERFANAVVSGRLDGWEAVDPESVVAITYTEKAAGEIAERVRIEIGGAHTGRAGRRDDLWISTIHGFCSRILRSFPFEAGIDPLFTVADTLQAGRLREQAFREVLTRLDREGAGIRELLDAYGEDATFAAVLEISRQLVVAGLNADAIELEDPPTVEALIAEARGLFADGTAVCDIEYSGKSTTHLEHAETCRVLLEECSVLGALDRSAQGDLERLRQLALQYEPIRRLGGFEDLREEMGARKNALLARVATAITVPFRQAMVELVGAYADAYAGLKEAAGVLDFEDLQIKAVRLIENRPDIAARLTDRFKVVMIDEFQDTDALQLELVERLAGPNLCTVGDEMQSIYGFRGADVEVYRKHRRAMADAGALQAELSVNYRSHPEIIGFVNAVFGSGEYDRNQALPLAPVPTGRPVQPLDEVAGPGSRVEVLFVDAGQAGARPARAHEAAEIADRLAALIERGMAPGDVAILLRAYTDAHVYADALARRGIPAAIVGGGRFFGLAETVVMKALTRAIANVADETALGLLLVSEFTSVSDDALLRLRLDSRETRLSLWAAIGVRGDSLDPADAQALGRLRNVIETARARVGRERLDDVLLKAVEESGYDLRLLRRGNMGRDAFANVLKFARRAAEFELSEGSGPAGFALHLDDKERLHDLEAPDSAGDDASNAVRIMSIHASKGLEFPMVVVPDIGRKSPGNSGIVRTGRTADSLRLAVRAPRADEESKSPPDSEWFSAFDEAAKDAEEQGRERLFYVALTRARDLLLVSGWGPLNPKASPASKSDLVKLIRVLGHDLPIGGPRDEVVSVGAAATCRLRVVQVEDDEPGETAPDVVTDDLLPLPVGEPFGEASPRTNLPQTVSYTQLSEFARCPLQFKIRRVLGVAPPQPVSPGHDPKRFGNALHSVLRLVSRRGELPGAKRIEAIARYFELDRAELDRLTDAAARYCGSDIARRAGEADVVLHEAPLSIAVDGGRFVIAGSIDLYARSDDASLIIDYKSGASGAPEELPSRYRLQAECYALAALRDGCESVEVVFARPEVTHEGQPECVSFEFGSPDAQRIEAELAGRYREIEASEFSAAPGAACGNCEVPVRLCEYRGKESRR